MISACDLKRCLWSIGNPLMLDYHDNEWGVPVHSDTTHFEFFVLDAAQAGLSWNTILQKREGYRKAFNNFDIEKVSKFSDKKINELLLDTNIVRNRQKITSAIINAKGFINIQNEYGSFDNYIWTFVNNVGIINNFSDDKDIPAKSNQSEAMSKDLKKRGFQFVGPIICYSYMQAAGLVNDHVTECFRFKEVQV